MNLIESLKECGALKFGDFVLASGKKSNYYVDIKKASTSPTILKKIAELMANQVEEDRIAGMELGAVPIAVALSLETNKPCLIIRKETKAHGTQKRIEGEFNKGETVVVVDDVTTTGGSLVQSVLVLRSEGLTVEKVLTVVDREEGGREAVEETGVEFIPLVSASTLLDQ
jgi:orotate phosphoribosyltransferase